MQLRHILFTVYQLCTYLRIHLKDLMFNPVYTTHKPIRLKYREWQKEN